MKQKYKRPYATHYYQGTHDLTPAFSSQGAAASERGAIRATVVRIFEGQWMKAIIHDRITGVALYTIKRGAQGISVHYGSNEGTAQLRRVK